MASLFLNLTLKSIPSKRLTSLRSRFESSKTPKKLPKINNLSFSLQQTQTNTQKSLENNPTN
jgi:hypothetical protein